LRHRRRPGRGRALIGSAALVVVIVIVIVPAPATAALPSAPAAVICDKYCDAMDPALSPHAREGTMTTAGTRRISLHFDDNDGLGRAAIGGAAGDQAWLDRSFDAGRTWASGSRLGNSAVPAVPAGATGQRTLMYHADGWANRRVGLPRACGQPAASAAIAALRNRISGDTTYPARARAGRTWFSPIGVINDPNLVNDGISVSTCRNNGAPVQTYDGGVPLAGLHRDAGDPAPLTKARAMADTSTTNNTFNPGTILGDPGDAPGAERRRPDELAG
jgi:hypothetical protein